MEKEGSLVQYLCAWEQEKRSPHFQGADILAGGEGILNSQEHRTNYMLVTCHEGEAQTL